MVWPYRPAIPRWGGVHPCWLLPVTVAASEGEGEDLSLNMKSLMCKHEVYYKAVFAGNFFSCGRIPDRSLVGRQALQLQVIQPLHLHSAEKGPGMPTCDAWNIFKLHCYPFLVRLVLDLALALPCVGLNHRSKWDPGSSLCTHPP